MILPMPSSSLTRTGGFFSVPFTRERARVFMVQHSFFNLNRRDCWAYVQAAAPLDVKKIIWEHEEEELSGDKERGVDNHFTLVVKQGASVGLNEEDFHNAEPMDGTATCMQAWAHVANNSPWLEALAASAALELSNSEEILTGGSLSRRIADKLTVELGIPLKKQHSNAEHIIADVDHAHLLMRVAERHAHTEEASQQVLRGVGH